MEDCVHHRELGKNEDWEREQIDRMDPTVDDEVAQDAERDEKVNTDVVIRPGMKYGREADEGRGG